MHNNDMYKIILKYGSVYDCARYLRENYDSMPDHIMEPLLFRLLDQLLPEAEEK